MDEIIEKLRDKSVYKDSMSPLIKKDIEVHIPRNLRNRSNGTERCSALI